MSGFEYPRINILGVGVTPVDLRTLRAHIVRAVRERQHVIIANANVHALNLAYEQTWFRDFLNSAHLVFCDGAGVQLAARILGHTPPPRITYADWTWELAELCASKGFSLFLLGGQPGVAEMAALRLVAAHPALRIAGVCHGYFDKVPFSADNEAILGLINKVKPDILLVCFGMPLQEQWLRDNWDHIDAHVALTGGAALDYVAGRVRRGPNILVRHGFEWLARLAIEPRRLWRRYVLGNPRFLWRLVKPGRR